jgi:hypothetical protein
VSTGISLAGRKELVTHQSGAGWKEGREGAPESRST